MKEKDFYTLEEIEDEFIGVKGTPKRDKYEADLNAFLIGEAIKQAREARNLTQEQQGEGRGGGGYTYPRQRDGRRSRRPSSA